MNSWNNREILLENGRRIGPSAHPFIIAEISGNHNGDLERAHKLIDAAKWSGADAVKLQTYTADTMTINHDGPDFQITEGPWAGRQLYDLYRWAHTPWEWHAELVSHCRDIGIMVFSTPFDESAVDFLAEFDMPIYKIASFEMTDHRLIRKVATKGRPVVMSTGLSTLAEVADSVGVARAAGIDRLVLLHCVSAYPAPVEDVNLRTIAHLADAFDLPVGLSDHTLGTAVPVAAVAAGAVMIEKHLTLRRADGGPDAAFSLEPEEMKRLVDDVRVGQTAMGRVCYDREPSEEQSLVFRRSIYCVRDMKEGELFCPENIRIIRPGYGLAPRHFDAVLGRRVTRDCARGTALSWSLVG